MADVVPATAPQFTPETDALILSTNEWNRKYSVPFDPAVVTPVISSDPQYPQRQITGVKRDKKDQLVKGGYKKR